METIAQTQNWLMTNLTKTDDFDVTIITPYPGSPYYDDAVERDGKWIYTVPKTGDRLFMKEVNYFEEADYYKGGPGDYKSYVWTETLTASDLVQARDCMERDVRRALGISYPSSQGAQKFEHSMGMSGLPASILRRSESVVC